jgi:hypothetical protein
VNVFAMFGPQCTEFELQLKDVLQNDSVRWLSGRRPQCTSVFHPRIAGIWSVFLVVGAGPCEGVGESVGGEVGGEVGGGFGGAEESEPTDAIKSAFPELLQDSPTFLLAHGAEMLWPGWVEWQQLVSGGYPKVRVTRLAPAASPLTIVAALRHLTCPVALVGSVAV